MENKNLQEGEPNPFKGFPGHTPLGSLVSSPVGMEGRLTWPLYVIRRGFYPCEMFAVIQLLSFKDDLMAPSVGLDPLCVVVEVLEAIPMYLLVKVI